MLRIDHATKKKQWAKKPAVTGPPARHIQAEAKRQAVSTIIIKPCEQSLPLPSL